MNSAAHNILVVDSDVSVALAIGAALRRRGHSVTVVHRAEHALAFVDCEVLVAAFALEDESGLELARRFAELGSRAAPIFLADQPNFDDCRAALQLGALDVLAKPFGLDELARAVDSVRPSPLANAKPATSKLALEAPADADGLDRAMRELLAFTVRAGFGPSTRARIASAGHELIDNVLRHAYVDLVGTFELSVELVDRELVVAVSDRGIGLDAVGASIELAHASNGRTRSGLARVAALAEDLRLESTPGRGVRATARFAAYRVDFDEGETVDLAELDYLTPEMTSRVLASVERNLGEPLYNLSPALAVSVGRLLAGPTHEKSLRVALWS